MKDIDQLKKTIATFKTQIELYKTLFNADGTIDEREQDILDNNLKVIENCEKAIRTLQKHSKENPQTGNNDKEEKQKLKYLKLIKKIENDKTLKNGFAIGVIGLIRTTHNWWIMSDSGKNLAGGAGSASKKYVKIYKKILSDAQKLQRDIHVKLRKLRKKYDDHNTPNPKIPLSDFKNAYKDFVGKRAAIWADYYTLPDSQSFKNSQDIELAKFIIERTKVLQEFFLDLGPTVLGEGLKILGVPKDVADRIAKGYKIGLNALKKIVGDNLIEKGQVSEKALKKIGEEALKESVKFALDEFIKSPALKKAIDKIWEETDKEDTDGKKESATKKLINKGKENVKNNIVKSLLKHL